MRTAPACNAVYLIRDASKPAGAVMYESKAGLNAHLYTCTDIHTAALLVMLRVFFFFRIVSFLLFCVKKKRDNYSYWNFTKAKFGCFNVNIMKDVVSG